MGPSGNFQKPASFPCLPAELTPNSAVHIWLGTPNLPALGAWWSPDSTNSRDPDLMKGGLCRAGCWGAAVGGLTGVSPSRLSLSTDSGSHFGVWMGSCHPPTAWELQRLCVEPRAPQGTSDPKPFPHCSSIACQCHHPPPDFVLGVLLSPRHQPLLLGAPEPVPHFLPFALPLHGPGPWPPRLGHRDARCRTQSQTKWHRLQYSSSALGTRTEAYEDLTLKLVPRTYVPSSVLSSPGPSQRAIRRWLNWARKETCPGFGESRQGQPQFPHLSAVARILPSAMTEGSQPASPQAMVSGPGHRPAPL